MKIISLILLFIKPVICFTQSLELKNYEDYMPTSNCGEIIHYNYYSISFCEEYKLSEWTIHYLTPDKLGTQKRTNDFRKDPQLNGRDASLSDFKGSGFDRGHMVPAGDMTYNKTCMSESFFMTNISPQLPNFNRGAWKEIEIQIREWVKEYDTAAIITGAIHEKYPKKITKWVGDSLPVPNYFYKIFIDIQRKKSIAFLMPNKKITREIDDYIISIRELEKRTGLDFFYKLNNRDEKLLEKESNIYGGH